MESQILVKVPPFPNIVPQIPWILIGFGITAKTDRYLYLTAPLEAS